MKKFTAFILVLLTFFCLLPCAYAAEVKPDIEVSGTDKSYTDMYGTGIFLPAEFLPSFATVPEFYIKVENVNGLYMFMDRYGAAHKRRYGSIDGVYGWYETSGASYDVADHSFPVNVAKDRELAYAGTPVVSGTDYIGILPPDEGVTEVTTIFGVKLWDFILWAGIFVVVVCGIIAVVGVTAVNKKRRQFRNRW